MEDTAHLSDTSTQHHKRTTELLQDVLNNCDGEKISIGALTDLLGDRAFGFMIFLLAFPNALPMPPGFSAITGIPLVILAVQYVLGRRHPQFPEFIRKRELSHSALAKAVKIITPVLRFLETLLRPRLAILTKGWFEKLTGCVILFLALILLMPLPGANMLPALSIAIIALGVIERDGLVIGLGTALGIGSSIFLYKIGKAVIVKIIGWVTDIFDW